MKNRLAVMCLFLGFSAGAVAAAPVWSVDADRSLTEGLAGTNLVMTFTVKLSETSSVPCSVGYLTESVTALADSEYVSASGMIDYPAGVNSNAYVSVTVLGNNALDGTRTFKLKLTNAVASTIGTASRIGTIVDKTGLTLSAPSVAEGAQGETNQLDFVLTLTTPDTTDYPAAVTYETVGVLAVAGVDYAASTGSVAFAEGESVLHIQIPVFGNDVFQADRTLKLNVSTDPRGILLKTATGTIVDDEQEPARVGLQPGESLAASIFPGATVNTSVGNPNFDGQSWYQANCSTSMKYYENPVRWGSSEVPGDYPAYLGYSVVQYDDTVTSAIKKTDGNAKTGAAWIYEPLYRADYEIFFDRAYAYPTGAGNVQIWKIACNQGSGWVDLVPYRSFPDAPKAGGYGPGTNLVVSLNPGDRIAFIFKTGGDAYAGGTCRIEGLGIRRDPPPGTLITLR